MRRRSFLAAIAAAFVAPDPEKLLWQPGKKLISIPSVAPVQRYRMELVVDITTHSTRGPWRETVRSLIEEGTLRFEPIPSKRAITAPARRQFP